MTTKVSLYIYNTKVDISHWPYIPMMNEKIRIQRSEDKPIDTFVVHDLVYIVGQYGSLQELNIFAH